MAKTLTFRMGDSRLELSPKKVDRDKLYGHTELRVLNADGRVCSLASINSDGVNIICPGATKIGITDDDGNWVDKQTLIPMTTDGNALSRIPSSFDSEINLTREVTTEQLLDLNIQSVYQLTGAETTTLAEALGNRIFTFDFSYRGGYECATAFLLANQSGVFLLTGVAGKYDYIGLDESGEFDGPEEELNIEDGELDFSMM